MSNVSHALYNHHSIGLKTKMRIQELAKELNYEPNQTAIFFQQRKTFTLGDILPELSESFFSSAMSGIEDCAYKNNYIVLIGQSHDNEENEKLLTETMKNHRQSCFTNFAGNKFSFQKRASGHWYDQWP